MSKNAWFDRLSTRVALGAITALLALASPWLARADDMRIVAAGGLVTEVLYALGAENRLVGVDATSLEPASALRDKPNVGYMRQLSPEGILSLKPTRVIAIPGAGPPGALDLIRAAGASVETIPEAAGEFAAAANIRAVGAAAGLDVAAEALASQVEARLRRLAAARERVAAAPRRVMFVLALREGRPMVAGRATGADAIIRLAGGVNAFHAVEGYKAVSEEAVIAAAPDVILAMDRAGARIDPAALFATPAFAATPAARTRRFVSMDAQYLLAFGPRTPQAARDLMAALYPEQPIPSLDADR